MFHVEPDAITGTWIIDDSARHYLPEAFKGSEPEIELNANGTFVATDMPGLLSYNEDPVRPDSGSGVWRLSTCDGEQCIQLDFQAIADIEKYHFWDGKAFSVPFGTQLYVSGWRKTSLCYYIGDPDSGRKITFLKAGK